MIPSRHLFPTALAVLTILAPLPLSATNGFKTDVTNGTGAAIGHRQTNAQVMYSYRF